MQVTDVELQAGEVVTHINLGDSTRWTVESALSGSGSEQVEHLIVKPRDIGLSTSLVVTTDRRTYHLLLVSDETEFMHDVTFLYREALSPTTPPSVASATPAPSPVAADPPARRHGDGKQVRLIAKEPADMYMKEPIERTMWVTLPVSLGVMLDMDGSPVERWTLDSHSAKNQ